MTDIMPFTKLFMIMVPITVITCLFSYIQLEEEKQLLALQFGLGSICCEEKNLLSWALERQYNKVTKHVIDSGKEDLFTKQKFDFIDAEKLQVFFRDVCAKEWLDVVEKLMKHPYIDDIIVSKDDQGQTGFMHACGNRKANVVKLILKHPLNFEIITQKDNEGRTGFMLACDIGFIDVVEVLLKHQSIIETINDKDQKGDTALHIASGNGFIEGVKHLIANGADPNIMNKKGENALHIASGNGFLEGVKHLIANGADP